MGFTSSVFIAKLDLEIYHEFTLIKHYIKLLPAVVTKI